VVVSQLAGGHINISLLAAEPVVFSLFGAGIVLIFIKFLFLFGVFPFQYYTIDAICSMSWSGILIFLIFLKMPALFAYMIFIDIYGALAADYKSLLLVIALMSVFVTTLKMFSTFRLGTFFGISSANQFSYIVLVSLFANPKALYAVFAIFVSYACALAIVMIVFNAVSDADGRDLGS